MLTSVAPLTTSPDNDVFPEEPEVSHYAMLHPRDSVEIPESVFRQGPLNRGIRPVPIDTARGRALTTAYRLFMA